MVYRVVYLIASKDTFDPKVTLLPRYVVAEDFDSAVKTARKFETDNVTLFECASQLNDGYVTIARGFKGLGNSSKIEEVTQATG